MLKYRRKLNIKCAQNIEKGSLCDYGQVATVALWLARHRFY
ncbi:hypothetical protein BDE02_17G111200 [Populus trichocarpa]|nr:hypothetical protein BDE02_17G111200 [Populus trichocarpa]